VPLFRGRDPVGQTKCHVERSSRAANYPDQVAKRVRQQEDGTAIFGLLLRRFEEVPRVLNAVLRRDLTLRLRCKPWSGEYAKR
jgi:hypothetical protein